LNLRPCDSLATLELIINECLLYRGYYTAVRRYDFYLLVLKTIFYSLAALIRKIFFSPLEDKSHIFKPPCNVLFIIYSPKQKIAKIHAQKQIGKSHVIDIFTSEDMENISLCIFQYLTLYYIINFIIIRTFYKLCLFQFIYRWRWMLCWNFLPCEFYLLRFSRRF
jgi:hypothetical protein